MFFENNSLEIIAESKHIGDNLVNPEQHFYFDGLVYFDKNHKGKRIFLDKDIDDFINNVGNYDKYITAQLNDIDIDINIW